MKSKGQKWGTTKARTKAGRAGAQDKPGAKKRLVTWKESKTTGMGRRAVKRRKRALKQRVECGEHAEKEGQRAQKRSQFN